MNDPLVSVIIPCFNNAPFLDAAFRSVCDQQYQSWELIFVDDGSNDGSLQVATRWRDKDERIKVLSQENAGASAARNAGIEVAQGKYMAFLDGDDWWHPEKLARHVAHLESDPSVGVSYSGTRFVAVDGTILRHKRRPRSNHLSDYYLYCRNPITNGSNALFRAEALKLHRFDVSLPKNQDVDCWLRIAFSPVRWQFAGLPELLTYYRVSPGGLSSSDEAHLECARRVWKKSFDYAPAVAGRFARLAEAFQLRFYARRALAVGNFPRARRWWLQALQTDRRLLVYEPLQSLATALCIMSNSRLLLRLLGLKGG